MTVYPAQESRKDARAGDGPTVATIMTPLVIGVSGAASLPDALAVMLQSRIRHLPIVSGKRCLGVLYESDALWELYLHEDQGMTAGECARPTVPAIGIEARVGEAASVLGRAGAEAVIVLDKLGAVAGIVTATDIVRSLASHVRHS